MYMQLSAPHVKTINKRSPNTTKRREEEVTVYKCMYERVFDEIV